MSKNKRNNFKYIGKKRAKEDRDAARRLANENLERMQKPRKPVSQSFIAEFDNGECPKCYERICAGDKVRYNNEGVLVHVSHKTEEKTYTVCDKCFLVLPCLCEE